MTKNLHIDTQAMRAKILDLAIQGKLTDQRAEDGNAQDLLKEIQAEKEKLIKEKKIKKEKKLPEIMEEEKTFDIPENWMWVRIGNIFTLQSGKSIKANEISVKQYDEYRYPCFGGNGIRGYVKAFNREGDYPIIGRQGALCGNINFSSGKFYATEHAVVTDGYSKVNAYWAVIFLKALNLNQYATATAQPGLSVTKINTVLIPLPPLAEQNRIVGKVSALFAQLDSIDKAYEEYQELQQAMKSKLLDLAIQGKLTDQRAEDGNAQDLLKEIQAEKEKLIKEKKIKKEKPLPAITEEEKPFEIPKNWEWVRLGDLGAPIQYPFADGPFGSNLKKEHYTTNREVRIIQLSNIGENGWRDENVKYTTFEHLKLISRSEVDPGDIVIAKMMPAGRAIIVPDKDPKYVLSSDAVKFVPNKHLYLPFVINCINSPVFQNQVTANVQGTTRKRTSLSKLKNCLLPIPPLAEQKRIVSKLDKLLSLEI